MWNKRKEEEYPPKAGPAPAAPANQPKENPPMSTAPAASHHVSDSRGPAIIGKSVMIKGQIFSREDLTIDVAIFPATKPECALVISSGIHGVEGAVGSAVQLGMLREWASRKETRPAMR